MKLTVHVVDNLPMERVSSYNRQKIGCEFCGLRHNQQSGLTCDLMVNGLSANSETGSREITIGQVFKQLMYKRDLVLGVIIRVGHGAKHQSLEISFDKSLLNEA